MEETLQLLRTAREQGFTGMIATPHYHPGRYLVDSRTVLDKVSEVRRECEKYGIDIQIYPGQECYWYTGLIDALESGDALTMNHSRYVLVEFEPVTIYSTILSAVSSLIRNGYQVIIAHFERYECLNGRQDRLEELHNEGAYLQLNFDCLLHRDSLFRKNPWRRLLQEGTVDFLGSDTHGMHFRPLHADAAFEWMTEHVEEQVLWKVLVNNPSLLL